MERDTSQIEKKIILDLKSVFDKKVLEIGCGSGYLTKILALTAKTLTAVDPDQNKLAIARRDKAAYPIPVQFLQLSGEELLIIQDNSVDVVFFSYSLHHHTNPEKALAEAKRVLAPGGQIILIEPRADGDYCRFLEPVHDERVVLAKADRMIQNFPCSNRSYRVYYVDWLFSDKQDLLWDLRLNHPGSDKIINERLSKYPDDRRILIKDKVVLWTLIL